MIFYIRSFIIGLIFFTFSINITAQWVRTNGPWPQINTGSDWIEKNALDGLPGLTSIDAFAIQGTSIITSICGNEIYRSTDGGNSWHRSSMSLLNVSSFAIIEPYI